MSNSDKLKVKGLTDDELLDQYFHFASEGSRDIRPDLSMKYAAQAGIYLTELNRRANEKQREDNKKSNRVMIICTIAITIMTAVILWATLIGSSIISYGR